MPERKRFLVCPHGLTCREVTASRLLTVNLTGRVVDAGSTRLGYDRTAFAMHSAIYGARPKVQCIIHICDTAATAVCQFASWYIYNTDCAAIVIFCIMMAAYLYILILVSS